MRVDVTETTAVAGRSCVATHGQVPTAVDAQHEKGPLPVVGLLGLAASAGFAVWTSLTCFVC